MLFTELRFLYFFALVFVVYWSLPSNRLRKMLLLAASYVFYAAWDYRFLSLLFASTGIDYVLGVVLSSGRPVRRRRWLAVSIVANLTFLGFFKYYDFFAESAATALQALGVDASLPFLHVVLPAGISFYTFMSMGYTIDVYRGERPAKSFLDFAVFVAFFPHLVAGPILRAKQLLPQLEQQRRWADVAVRAALVTFLVGYVKKACVADNLAPLVDRYFADPSAYDAKAAVIAVVGYAVQIYCDFSGYSDMAIGTAKLLGYDLCRNFDTPYLASSVTGFWRRWHISLSTWLRDYVYVPLGGNRAPYRNVILTMLLGGLWHGAAWRFVVWGGLHGVALAVERFFGIGRSPTPADRGGVSREALGIAVTFFWVCCAWIFFRAPSLSVAMVAARSFVFLQSPGTQTFPTMLFGMLAVLGIVHAVGDRPLVGGRSRRMPTWAFAPMYGFSVAVAVACVPIEQRPFIYFQF